jgi:hypothetical protein
MARVMKNRASVPITKELIDLARASPLTYHQLERKAGIGHDVIAQWAVGKYGGSAISLTCVGEVLGYRLKWEKIDDDRRA